MNLDRVSPGQNVPNEINVIIPGANYGWPDVIGDETENGLTNPALHSGDDTWAPSGASFYCGEEIPHWNGKYFVVDPDHGCRDIA